MERKKIKGRGTAINPANRFLKVNIVDFLPDEKDHFYSEDMDQKPLTQYFTDHSKSVISVNNSADVNFDYSVNPYKGCEHGCVYCYARPTHEYLGFSTGLDFETKIMIKENAHLLLEKKFQSKSYKPDVIIFSGNTDCYQPVERKLELTRKCLMVCEKYNNPVSLITKNALVQRDIDILKKMSERNLVTVTLSITTLDSELQRKMEPRTSSPAMRIGTIGKLAENNIPVGVNVAPVIPGLTDEEIPEILKTAASAGAEFAGYIILRLPYSIKELFADWLEKEYPLRKEKILNKLLEMNNGKLYSPEPGVRFSGSGVTAENIKRLFELSCRKYKLNENRYKLESSAFKRNNTGQIEIF
jgi:DNA repair photolyase